jgi:UDP-N-acetyl-2-amino-2-deoxyglucuronate dehydrogenase
MICRFLEVELVDSANVRSLAELGFKELEVLLFSSIEQLLDAQLEIDVVNIATPNGFHAKHSLKVLEARKHIIMQKHMALNKADAEKVMYKTLSVH